MPVGARKDSIITVISICPDLCYTPMGAGMELVPYQIYTDLSASMKCIDSVRFNGKPCFVHDHSLAPTVQGDEPGTGGGIISGVNVARTWALQASTNVRAGGYRIARVGDLTWMNVSNE